MSDDLVEQMAAKMYGENWNSPQEDKRPGEKMKDVWRTYCRRALEPVQARIEELEAALAKVLSFQPDALVRAQAARIKELERQLAECHDANVRVFNYQLAEARNEALEKAERAARNAIQDVDAPVGTSLHPILDAIRALKVPE